MYVRLAHHFTVCHRMLLIRERCQFILWTGTAETQAATDGHVTDLPLNHLCYQHAQEQVFALNQPNHCHITCAG